MAKLAASRNKAAQPWAKKKNRKYPERSTLAGGVLKKANGKRPAGKKLVDCGIGTPPIVNMSVMHGPGELNYDNNNSGPSFPYQPLDKTKLEIRLLTFNAGKNTDQIECILEHVSTSKGHRPMYKALSYTWGSPEINKSILLSGMLVQVRGNLWQALYHLRNEDTDLRIWIDAISINQNDVEERNQQVSRMGTIYGLADEVIVWLGPERDDSGLAMSFINQHFSEHSTKLLPLSQSATEFSSQLRAVERLTIDRDYWQRVWIIQEIFRARKITVHCGPQQARWTSLARFFRQISKESATINEGLRFRLEQLNSSPAAKLTQHRTSRAHDLEELLMTYRDSLSSDPRDKIYSLIGLANNTLMAESVGLELNHCVQIDYSKTHLYLFQSLVWMYAAEARQSHRVYSAFQACCHVRWMHLIQEILQIRGVCGHVTDLQLLKCPFNQRVSVNNEPGLLSTTGIGFPIHTIYYNGPGATIGPYCWATVKGIDSQDLLSLLSWHDTLPCSNSRTKSCLEQILANWNRQDFERLRSLPTDSPSAMLEGFEDGDRQKMCVLMTNDGQQFLFASCPQAQGARIVYFHDSDVAMFSILEDGNNKVTGRALPFWSHRDGPMTGHSRSKYAVFRKWWEQKEKFEDDNGEDSGGQELGTHSSTYNWNLELRNNISRPGQVHYQIVSKSIQRWQTLT